MFSLHVASHIECGI